MTTMVRIDPTKLSQFMRSENGPVFRHMMVVGEQIKQRAVGKLKDGFPREFLGGSIVKRMEMRHDGPVVNVGTDKTKTQPHTINGNPVLVFDWPKAGGVVFLRRVNHPGSDFGPYLTKILEESLISLRI